MAAFTFDASTVPPRDNVYELLPAGWYTAQVTESEIVPLQSGNGDALKLTFDVLSEGYRGRKVWARLNVRHSNAEAERISQQQLRELCDAIGITRITETSQLHQRPVEIRVKIREDKSGKYEPQNEIAGYRQIRAGAAPTGFPPISVPPRQQAATPSAAPPAAAPVPPWVKATA